jgi:hypothetical protein
MLLGINSVFMFQSSKLQCNLLLLLPPHLISCLCQPVQVVFIKVLVIINLQ